MPIKVKDHAKCKAWEQRRRDKLNDAFNNLAQLLPHYDPAKIPAKIEILEKSTEFVKELRLSNSRLLSSQAENDEKCRLIKELQDEVNRLILRVKQLTHLLKKANITIPVGPEIKSLGSKRLKWSGKLKPCDSENTVIPLVEGSSLNPLPTTSEENKLPSPEKDNTSNVLPDGEENESNNKTTESPQSENASASPTQEKTLLPNTSTNTPSIIIPLKEVNTSKSTAPPYIIASTVSTSPQKSNSTSNSVSSASGSVTTTATISSSASAIKLISSTEPIFTTNSTTAAPLQLPLQTFILTPCPITGSVTAVPAQTSQLFPRITFQNQVLSKPLESLPLQKIAIKPVLKPIPRVIKRRNRKSKKKLLLEAAAAENQKKSDPILKEGASVNKAQLTVTLTGKESESEKTDSDVPEIILEKAVDHENTKDKNAEEPVERNDKDKTHEQIDKSTKSPELEKGEVKNSKSNVDGALQDESAQNIPVLRIIGSEKGNDSAENEDILSKVVVAENVEPTKEKEKESEKPEIMCITLDDDTTDREIVAQKVPTGKESEKQAEKEIDNSTSASSNALISKDTSDAAVPTTAEETETGEKEASKTGSSKIDEEIQSKNILSSSSIAPQEALGTDTLASQTAIEDVEKDVPTQTETEATITDKGESFEQIEREVNVSKPTLSEISKLPGEAEEISQVVLESTTTVISTVTHVEINESQQIEAMEVTEYTEPRIELMPLEKATERSSKQSEPSKPPSSEDSVLNTPHKQKPSLDENQSVTTTDKISECIARSIDLIDANDSELMELGEHWDGPVASPRSPISPTQMFLNIFPLLPRESSTVEQHQSQPHTSQSQTPHVAGPSKSASRSSFFIDAMLPEDHSIPGGNSLMHESLELTVASSSQTQQCLALTPPQYSTSVSNQQPSSPFSFSNNYYWTHSASTSTFDYTLDYRPTSTSSSIAATPLFSTIPATVPSTTIFTTSSAPSTSKTAPISKSTSTPKTTASTTPASSRSSKVSKVSQASATSTTSSAHSKPTTSSTLDISTSLLSFSRSSSSRSTASTVVTTASTISSTNVTWTLTAPSQSASNAITSGSQTHQPHAHHHHHHHQINQNQSNAQISQFPSTSTCSLFDALAPMDASFFRPLMNALETNDFRGLEFPTSNVLPTPLPPLIPPPPPTKSLYPQKNVGLSETQFPNSMSIFDSTVQQPLQFSSGPDKEKTKRQKEHDHLSARNSKQNQQESSSSTMSPQKTSKAVEPKPKSSRGSKQKTDNLKQPASSSRSGKSSSRTQPYTVPSASVSTDIAKSSSRINQPPTSTNNDHQKNLFQSEYSHSYHCPSKKSSSSSHSEFQHQNFFMSNLASNVVVQSDTTVISPSKEHSKQQSSKSVGNIPNQSQPKSKEKSPSRSKARASGQQITAPSQSQVTPLQTATTTTTSSNNVVQPQQPVAHSAQSHSKTHTQSKSQGSSHASSVTVPQSMSQDLQFHHHSEPFSLFPEFQQQDPPASISYPAQITHQHHHPYYLTDITTSTFETCPTNQHPIHGHQNTFHTSSQIQHVPHNFGQNSASCMNTNISSSQAPISGKNIQNSNVANPENANTNVYNNNGGNIQRSQQHFPPRSSQAHQYIHGDNFQYNQQATVHTPTEGVHSHQSRASHQQRQEPTHSSQQRQTRTTSASAPQSKAKHHSQPQTEHGQTQQQVPPPPPIPFQPHATQQIHQQHSHQVPIQSQQVSSQHIRQQPQQQKSLSHSHPQQINRPSSSSRTVNWMTDTVYRTNTSRAPTSSASVHPTQHKPQQQLQQRQQNNPFSVSKLVGTTSGKSQSNHSSANAGHSSGVHAGDTPSKAKGKSNNNNPGHGSAAVQQPQSQSNYCAEALIRKDTTTADWNEFQFSHYPTHQHSHPQTQQNLNPGDFTNYHSQYYHHEPAHSCNQFNQGTVSDTSSAQIQHFHHPPPPPPPQNLNTANYHSSQQHQHNQSQTGGQVHYQNAPNSLHSFHQNQHHSYHHQPHHGHTPSSTSSVSNFNLSSIFPEINDKRNNNASASTQNQGPSNQPSSSQQVSGATGNRSGMAVSSRASGGNMCNFQNHPGFSNSAGNSGNNANMHH